MSKDNKQSLWDDLLIAPSSPNATDKLFINYKLYRDELSVKDIESQLCDGETAQEFLSRLALQSVQSVNVLYRKNDAAHETKIFAWLASTISRANRAALELGQPFDSLSVDDVRDIAMLSANPENITRLPGYLADNFGIILQIQPGYPAMKMDGCVLRLETGNPMVGISLRYNRYDNFWFTLLHELSHICLHEDQLDTPIIDDLEVHADNEIETEANLLARESFVPRREWRILYENRHDDGLLGEVCEAIGVHPDVVAGLIRHAAADFKLYPKRHRTVDLRRMLGFKNA
jgi:HTH-type transcriptional regulator/antitoxin HigA